MSKRSVFSNKKYLQTFFATAVMLFIAFFSIAYFAGFVPDELAYKENDKQVSIIDDEYNEVRDYEESVSSARPTYIEIPSVNIKTTVLSPASVQVDVLDQALLKGAVYYPNSGTVGEGNILVFGHSTGLKVVQNQAFKTFNNLKNVNVGDEVYVTGEDGVTYVYKTISKELVNDDEALVTFDTTERMITLSTCNTFGAKQERHVVKAVFDRTI